MIDLQALKEQLKLLGHDLPDEQVVAILKEMNIGFADEPTGAADPQQTSAKTAGVGAPRTGSILDGFQGRTQPSLQQQHPATSAGAAVPHQASVQQSFNYGYTSPAHGAAVGLDPGKLAGGMPPRSVPVPASKQIAGNGPASQVAGSEYSDDCYDHDSDDELDAAEEPGVSCRYCVAESGTAGGGSDSTCGHMGVHRAWTERAQAADPAAGRSLSVAGIRSLGPGDLAEQLGRATLNGPSAGVSTSRQPRFEAGTRAKGTEAARPSSAARAPQPGGAAVAKDQHYKLHGPRAVQPGGRTTQATLAHGLEEDEEDDGSDVGLSDPDKDPLHLGGSLEGLRWQQGELVAPRRAAQDPYASWLGGRGDPLATHLADALLAQRRLSPQASNRSVASRATSSYSIGSRRGGGAKKVDRVQRYQQLQQEWSQNRFLKQANGTSRGTSRKPVNFHNHFASLHAAEEAERQRMLRETRAKTKKELGSATEAPTANRRDELRWQTRMRLKNQT